MNDMMEYKGYLGSLRYSNTDDIFFGKVEFIRSLLSYEGESVQTLKQSFHEAIDDYLLSCSEQGREPEKPFKGTFNIRIGQQLHRQAALHAESHHITLNHLMSTALQHYLNSDQATPS